MQLTVLLSLLAAVLLAGAAAADPAPDLPLPAGTRIAVGSYDAATSTFAVYAVALPCEGLSYVTPAALAAALVGTAAAADIARDPREVAGREVVLVKELETTANDAIVAAHEAGEAARVVGEACD